LLHLEYSFVWCWKLNTSGSRSEITRKFWNVKNGEGWRSTGPIRNKISIT
jgi:hypothetical protein